MIRGRSRDVRPPRSAVFDAISFVAHTICGQRPSRLISDLRNRAAFRRAGENANGQLPDR